MGNKVLHELSGEMVVHGTLLLIFGLLLFGLKPIEEIVVFQFVPLPHQFFYDKPWFILIPLVVLVAGFFIWRSVWRKRKLMGSVGTCCFKAVSYLVRCFFCLIILLIIWLIPTVPTDIFNVLWVVLGVVALLASFAFMVSVFWKQCAVEFDNRIKNPKYKYMYWQIFLLVYLGSWLQGLSVIPIEGTLFGVIDWPTIHNIVYVFGFVWFVVIAIITFGDFPQPKKQAEQTN
ncbi:MAG: hypothetical protein PVJ61_07980 [Dehalococcoidia bacterium]|jgi:hypothetical protein